MQKLARPAFFSLLSITLAGTFLIHFRFFSPIASFTLAFLGASSSYAAMAWILFRVELRERTLYTILALAFALRLTYIAVAPIGSEDLYRYIWDGAVQSHGINPYLFAPSDERLVSLHTSMLPAVLNFPGFKTIYFPFSEWIFFASYLLSGEGVWGFKAMILLAEMGTITGLLIFLRQLSIPVKFVLLYAVSPLPIIQFAVDGHLDAIGLPLLIFAIAFFLRGQKLTSALLLGLSLSVKPVGLILLPAMFFYEKGLWARVRVVGIPLLIFGVQFIPYAFASNPFEMLLTFTKNWSFNGIVFEGMNFFLANNQMTRLVCGVLLGLSVTLLALRRADIVDTCYFSVLLLILLSPVVHPWYAAWVACMVPFARRWSGIALISTMSLTSFTVMKYKLTGVWEQYPIVVAAEYLPVILFLVVELRSLLKRNAAMSLSLP